MSTRVPEVLVGKNLSDGWAQVFLRLIHDPPRLIPPLLLSIGGFDQGRVSEDSVIRNAVDEALEANDKYSSEVSGMTIFPHKQWERRGRPPREVFFRWYLDQFLPRLKARDQRNRTGTYFERMIGYQGSKRNGSVMETKMKDQLDHIITVWHRDRAQGTRPRQSALQVSCFDPVKDHTGQRLRGFPCLQQLSLSYDDKDGLAVNAYYPTQYVFDRGYGNYLGLAHLGLFMAHELQLQLVRLNCFIVHPELGNDVTKERLRGLADVVQHRQQPVLPAAVA